MSELIELKCPNCGANLSIETDREACFCQYCGSKIMLQNNNEKTINININNTETKIDAAEILKAKNAERKILHQIEKEKANASAKRAFIKILLIVGPITFIAAKIYINVFPRDTSLASFISFVGLLGMVGFFGGLKLLWDDMKKK